MALSFLETEHVPPSITTSRETDEAVQVELSLERCELALVKEPAIHGCEGDGQQSKGPYDTYRGMTSLTKRSFW